VDLEARPGRSLRQQQQYRQQPHPKQLPKLSQQQKQLRLLLQQLREQEDTSEPDEAEAA
jgi:hypothetical protein